MICVFEYCGWNRKRVISNINIMITGAFFLKEFTFLSGFLAIVSVYVLIVVSSLLLTCHCNAPVN